MKRLIAAICATTLMLICATPAGAWSHHPAEALAPSVLKPIAGWELVDGGIVDPATAAPDTTPYIGFVGVGDDFYSGYLDARRNAAAAGYDVSTVVLQTADVPGVLRNADDRERTHDAKAPLVHRVILFVG